MKKSNIIFGITVILFTACGKKKDHLALVTTSAVTPFYVSAQCAGVLYLEGDETVVEKGFYWGTSDNYSVYDGKVICSGNSTYSGEITGLLADTKYFVQAYAINRFGTSYGKQVDFKTLRPLMPNLYISNASNILTDQATCQATVSFSYANNVSLLGICWATHSLPTKAESNYTLAAGPLLFSATMNDLAPNTVYYARAFATGSLGTVYSNEISFKTYYESVTDLDGNTYAALQIGSQVWMTSNLRVSRYNNGNPLPDVPVQNSWINLTSGACCSYQNDPQYDLIYGKYYNWYAVSDPRLLAPAGWRVASESDWATLVSYAGADAANKLLKGTQNSIGFDAEMSGYRDQGLFTNVQLTSTFWTSTESDFSKAVIYSIIPPINAVNTGPVIKKDGCVVRCIKN